MEQRSAAVEVANQVPGLGRVLVSIISRYRTVADRLAKACDRFPIEFETRRDDQEIVRDARTGASRDTFGLGRDFARPVLDPCDSRRDVIALRARGRLSTDRAGAYQRP